MAAVLRDILDLSHDPHMGFQDGEICLSGKNALLPVTWADKCQLNTATNYLFKGALERGVTGTIFGPSNSGKSFLALDMGLRLACGMSWQGHRCKRSGVLYIVQEGTGSIEKRVAAWVQANLAEDHAPVPFGIIKVPINLFEGGDKEKIIATVLAGVPDHITDIGLVTVDTVAQTMKGGDENSNSDMARYAGNLQAITAATGATVLGIHHNGKEASKGARGGYALTCALDFEIEVTADGDTRTATIKKQRDGETGQQYHFTLDRVEVGIDDENDQITSCIVRYLDGAKVPEMKLTPNQQTMFSILHEAGSAGLTVEDWNAKARADGLGTKRKADHRDFRAALKTKELIYEFDGRWFASR